LAKQSINVKIMTNPQIETHLEKHLMLFLTLRWRKYLTFA